MQSTNGVNEGMRLFKVNVNARPLPKVIYISKLKLAFLRNHLDIFKQILFVYF